MVNIQILYTDYNKQFTNAEVLLDENNKLKLEIQEETEVIKDEETNEIIEEIITKKIMLTMVDELGTEIKSEINKEDLSKLILLLQNMGRQI